MLSDKIEARACCPFCGLEFVIKDIAKLIMKLTEAFELMKECTLQELPEHLMRKIAENNNLINVNEQLDQQGHLHMMCMACNAIASWAYQYKQLYGIYPEVFDIDHPTEYPGHGIKCTICHKVFSKKESEKFGISKNRI